MIGVTVGAAVSFLLLSLSLISGRALGRGGLIERDRWPRTYWQQVIVLLVLSLAFLALALIHQPDLARDLSS